ncbi:SDR family NAD(P)-dependent oxidoreductase [Streptomyces sp. bgisy027]|uniref:SDR family NAD(P)-dependent oxidoreductase n=1 Tax=unclassified Streptomyces TaxID=2593676 RepID=UPI003D74C5D3
MTRRLEGRAAVVTGAGRGIGRAAAHLMAQEGAGVVVASLTGDTAEAVASEIRDAGGRAVAVKADVADPEQNKAMIDAALAEYGRIDILHNNAMLTEQEHYARDVDLLDFAPETFHRFMDVNVVGGILACKYALPHMLAQGNGSIIFTSSIASFGGDAMAFSYGATKATVDWYMKTIAIRYGKRGIRCNAIAPGVVRTASQQAWSDPDKDAAFLSVTNSPRLGEPEDIGRMAVFLATDDASWVNGAVIPVDGGTSASNTLVPALRTFLP